MFVNKGVVRLDYGLFGMIGLFIEEFSGLEKLEGEVIKEVLFFSGDYVLLGIIVFASGFYYIFVYELF